MKSAGQLAYATNLIGAPTNALKNNHKGLRKAMSLVEELAHAKSEEDVKDAYIKALGLKKVTKGLIDIQTTEVWFEAKSNKAHTYQEMFTQLLHYVQVALNAGDPVPALLAVVDTEKAALMKSSTVLPFLAKKTVKWGKSATKYDAAALAAISAHIGTHYIAFKLANDSEEFISTVKAAIKTGEIVRTQITPDNLKQVFDKWTNMIGREIEGLSEDKYVLLFFADIMNDGTVATHQELSASLLFKNGKPAFECAGKIYTLGDTTGYLQFWAMFDRPPPKEHRNYLLERRDSLIPVDERQFKGAFYTPLHVVDKAYDLLHETLGKNWQKDYVVWDMCCGVGNLEVKHSNHRNLFMSTLDADDIEVMKATKTCVQAERFQYDYLNDDITDFGEIDYTISKKVPKQLRDAIAAKKKILVLINPPYAEAANADNVDDEDKSEAKKGVATTRVASCMTEQGYGARELFIQFLVRIAKEMPTAKIAIFSKLKYVNAPNFEQFRSSWNAKYLGGFIVHSKAFDGLTGDFPIGFLVWSSAQKAKIKTPITQIETNVINKDGTFIGLKNFYNIPAANLLGDWIDRPRPNDIDALPLKNALTPTTSVKDVRGKKWADGAIGGMMCKGSDMQNAATSTALFSSGYCSAGGLLITDENLWQVGVAFAARLLIKKTWQNDRDQLLAPATKLNEEFTTDCLIWALFHGNNLTAGANGLDWNGRKWNLVNHFIPFTEDEVGSPGRFESNFMTEYLSQRKISTHAQAVLDACRPIWSAYFQASNPRSLKEQYFLNRHDVGWYQIRKTLAHRNNVDPKVLEAFWESWQALGLKLRPKIYSYGMLMQ